MPQSHEEMIKEFARMAGALNPGGTTTKPNKWKVLGKAVLHELAKIAAAAFAVLVIVILGWGFLDALHEVGVLPFEVTLWQAVRLIAPPLIMLLVVPITFNVRLKS